MTTRYDYEVFNVQSKHWRKASLVHHTGSEIKKRNNDKKIKQTDEHSKSEKQCKPMVGKTCKKGRFSKLGASASAKW